MTLRYVFELPSASQFKALYDTTGWGAPDRSVQFYERALQASWMVCSVYAGDTLIGFGRLISDGHLHAFITEMIVHPAAQRQGVGTAILGALLESCKEAGIADIQLFCAEGKDAFYKACGFAPRRSSMPGMQYVCIDGPGMSTGP